MKKVWSTALVFVSLCFCAPAAVYAQSTPSAPTQPRELSGRILATDAPEGPVALGEPIPIRVEIAHPPGVELTVPSSFGTGRWELLDASKTVVEGEDEWTTTLAMKFAVYRPGETTLDPFPIELTTADGEGLLMTRPFTVKVLSSLDDEAETFSPPRPPVTVWVEDNSLLWLGGFAGSALLLGLFFFGFRNRRETDGFVEPQRPAHEIALARLSKLAGDNLVERGEHMVFYVVLSETIRDYLGRRYGFKAVEMTTTEILGALDQADVRWPDGLSRDDVSEFLLHCDAVKFGGFIPSAEVASERLCRAFTIVELTRPRTAMAAAPDPNATGPETPSPERSAEVDDDPDARWKPPENDTTLSDEEEE